MQKQPLNPTDQADILAPRRQVSAFIQHLRANDFNVGTAQTISLLSHIAQRGIGSAKSTRLQMKIQLCSDKSQWDRFNELFEAFWFRRGQVRNMASPTENKDGPSKSTLWQKHLNDSEYASGNKALPQIESDIPDQVGNTAAGRLIATSNTVNARTDLRHVIEPEAMRAADRLALRLARAIRHRQTRRYRVQSNGRSIDLRRTFRTNIRHGGEPITLVRKSPPSRPVRIVVLLDVSGSMKHYSRFFLQFVKGLVAQWSDADAYLFHTRLVRVTDILRQKDAMAAMARLALVAQGFGGGTRLGDCLETFNQQYARTSINSRTVVFILSDGYDTGSPAQLQAQLIQMKRRVRKLVWLNPLLGWQNYAPVNAAMTAALPLIDVFAAANTLESLAKIEPMLETL